MVSRCTARCEISPKRRYESTEARSDSWTGFSFDIWYRQNCIPWTCVRDCRRMWQYKKTPRRMCCGVFGGSRGSRTPDPLLVRQTLWTNWAMLPNKLAPEPGLEPGTLWLTVRCSNQLSYSGMYPCCFVTGLQRYNNFCFLQIFFCIFLLTLSRYFRTSVGLILEDADFQFFRGYVPAK